MKLLNERGYYLGGTIPYGYQLVDTKEKRNSKKDKLIKKIVINNEEAKIVKMVFDWVIEKSRGGSLIAQELNKMGLTNREKIWRHNTIVRMLRNPIYMGYKKYNVTKFKGVKTLARKNTKREEWLLQPFNQELVIIPEDRFKKVQEIVDKRVNLERDSPKNEPIAFNVLLSGLAVCGYCGKKLKSDYSNKKNLRADGSVYEYRTYRYSCHNAKNDASGHRKRNYGAVTIDKMVEEEVLNAISSINTDDLNNEMDAFDFKEIELRKTELKDKVTQFNETCKALENVERLFDNIMSGKSSINIDFISKKDGRVWGGKV